MNNFLKRKADRIVDGRGKAVQLRGVNLGGWLMMEGYIMGAPNRAERLFKAEFKKVLGPRTMAQFENDFRQNFITSQDIKRIAGWGLNCLRVPFNSRLIETKPFVYDKAGLSYLERIVRWAKDKGLRVILDMHAACGAQNHDWHSDSLGPADLWTDKKKQKQTFALWEFIADRFKNEDTIAGYDLLNEAVVGDTAKLNIFYRQLAQVIRRVDRNHILFVEGNRWATDLSCLKEIDDDNMALSIHCYEPIDFTSNFIPHLSYPLIGKQGRWDRAVMQRLLERYKRISKERQLPVYVGEFGVNYRGGIYGEDRWLRDALSIFNSFGFHWTYWTYKSVKSSIFPDGLFSYMPNPPWVARQGPRYGWENYSSLWPLKRRDMVRSWRTQEFKENALLINVIKNASK